MSGRLPIADEDSRERVRPHPIRFAKFESPGLLENMQYALRVFTISLVNPNFRLAQAEISIFDHILLGQVGF